MLAPFGSSRSLRQLPSSATPRGPAEARGRLRTSAVSLAGVALIAVQLGWKAYLLSHFYFRQDDFQLMDHALSSGFGFRFLFTIGPEQLAPAGRAITWLLVRVSLYNWTLVSVVTIALLAAAGLAMLRLLQLLFGNRPAILIPLCIFLFTPLTVPGLSFWTTTVLWLPLQLAMILAISSHIRYVRSGAPAHAVAAAVWLGAGMLFDELGVLVPVLVFALTSAYFASGHWWQATHQVLRRYWRAWAGYGAVAAGYLAVFLIALPTSVQQPARPPGFASVLTLASTMLRVGFVPAATGGPWHWSVSAREYGYAAQTPVLTEVSWVVAALIVAASLCYRRRALRAWVILASWILLADLLPVAVSRLAELPASQLGADLHYVADSAPVLAICVGLACWPVRAEEQPYRVGRPSSVLLTITTVTLLGSFLLGSFWSGAAYVNQTSSTVTRSYIAHARVALARAPEGTVIVTTDAPSSVIFARFLGAAALTSRVLAPLAPTASRIRFTTVPDGAIRHLMIFTNQGTLRPTRDVGASSVSPAGSLSCWPLRPQPTRIRLHGRLFRYAWTVRLRYSGPAARIQVGLGTGVRDVAVPAGRPDLYVPLVGAGDSVYVRRLTAGPPACISSVTVGLIKAAKPAEP